MGKMAEKMVDSHCHFSKRIETSCFFGWSSVLSSFWLHCQLIAMFSFPRNQDGAAFPWVHDHGDESVAARVASVVLLDPRIARHLDVAARLVSSMMVLLFCIQAHFYAFKNCSYVKCHAIA
jgi:hypothetical protein